MGAVVLWISIPSGADPVAHVLLLCPSVRHCQDGVCGNHQHELRDIPQVRFPYYAPFGPVRALQGPTTPDLAVLRAVVPIGACYAGTLWLGNAAYLYLSVSFIQMLKV